MDKKAILLVSIGTSKVDVLERTTLQMLEEVIEKFKGYQCYLAFSSEVILDKINKISDTKYLSVDAAFEKMQLDGIEDVYVQPTFLLGGLECDKLQKQIEMHRMNFRCIKMSSSLLVQKQDYIHTLQAILDSTVLEEDEALLLIGHGTTHSANTTYQNLEYTAYTQGYRHVFVGTIDSEKSRRMLLRKLQVSGYRKICILPFLFVAGYHAWKDISMEPGSWKHALLEEGYEVRALMKGLGEYQDIRKIFLGHLENLLDS